MINKEKALKTFEKYVEKYNPEDEKIKIKIAHIQRVARNSKRIAQNLKLPMPSVQIGLLTTCI